VHSSLLDWHKRRGKVIGVSGCAKFTVIDNLQFNFGCRVKIEEDQKLPLFGQKAWVEFARSQYDGTAG
jgi:hypothetical protein